MTASALNQQSVQWSTGIVIALLLHLLLAMAFTLLPEAEPIDLTIEDDGWLIDLGQEMVAIAPPEPEAPPAPPEPVPTPPTPTPPPQPIQEPAPEPKLIPEPIPEPELIPELEPIPEPEPEPIPEPEPFPEPEPEPEPEPVPTPVAKPVTQPTPSPAPQPAAPNPVPIAQPPVPAATTASSPSSTAATPNTKATVETCEGGASYNKLVNQRIARKTEYPRRARRRRLEGTVRVNFKVQSSGNISDMTIVQSSSHKILDDAAITLLKRVNPLPAPPLGDCPSPLPLSLPVVYQLR